ncbi:putative RNA-directed DNA polymerase from transposon X-element [Trichonephila clavipes]|nr:putative RNA-directed DNA polymerase from transposon X-element [Trichonephila clavipes]
MTEPADYKYYRNVQTAQELILRTGNKRFYDITILLQHTEKAGSIPKSNPHLLHAELKNKIPRHDNITHMYFIIRGKIKISTSDPVCICTVQTTVIDQILNIPVKANIIWEGFTSRFLLFDILTTVHLTDGAIELKNSNDLDIVEIRRFVKPNSRQEASPVLITILGINTPECIQAELFAENFASNNINHEPLPLDYFAQDNSFINNHFHISELNRAIKSAKNTTPGADERERDPG